MPTAGVTVAVVFALALGAHLGAPAEPAKGVIALAPSEVRWVTPSYYTDGRQRAYLLGDSSKGGDWIDRVKIPGGSRVLAHTHPDEEIVTVIEGTWYLGLGAKFDETKLKAYPAGPMPNVLRSMNTPTSNTKPLMAKTPPIWVRRQLMCGLALSASVASVP